MKDCSSGRGRSGLRSPTLPPAPVPQGGRRARRSSARTAVACAVGAAVGGTFLAPAPFLPPARAAEPLNQDDQAAQLLNAGRRAYNAHDYGTAAAAFRDFTQRLGGRPDVPAAWYGLGLTLLDGPRDLPAAADAFRQTIARADAPDRPMALYFLGVALRGLGDAEARAAIDKPAEADARRAVARARYEEAAGPFGEAAAALAQKPKGPADAPEADPATAAGWVARARCDQADALLRAAKPKEAAAAAGPVADDPAAGPLRPLALYHLGRARFDLKEYGPAGQALSRLAPFDQPFGPHARYLLARVHHLSDERPEAAAQYANVVAGIDAARQSAKQALQQGGAGLPGDRRAFLEAQAAAPSPDYARRATFYQSVLLADAGKFAEARDGFAKFAADAKDHPLAPEARLRVGFCQLQLKQYADARAALAPLKDDAKLGDQAAWWLAKADLAAATDAGKPEAVEPAARAAVDLLRLAAARAQQLAPTDPAAKARRADVLLDLADAQVQAKAFRDAAGTYQTVVDEAGPADAANRADAAKQPDGTARAEEAAQRRVTALHAAGDFPASDEAARQFEQRFPKSTLLPAVWFRSAENAYLAAVDADKPGLAAAERERLFANAVVRYQKLITTYPEFPLVNAARQGIAASYARLGQYARAVPVLAQIPDADRTGDLATVAYQQADALVRTFPPEADDALSAARLIQTAEQAAKLLEGFVAANANGPLVPDALLKQGYCYQRMAGLLAEKPERDKALQLAREAYDLHQRRFRDHATAPAVALERAKLLAMQGDVGGATAELRRFRSDGALRAAPNAPLAAVRLAALLRSQGQAKEAVDLLAQVRPEVEPALARDPARAGWIDLLAAEHAAALKDAGRSAEAEKAFDELARRNAGKPAGTDAARQAVQCRREAVARQVAEARAKLDRPGSKREELDAAARDLEVAAKQLAELAGRLAETADRLAAERAAAAKAAPPDAPAPADPSQALQYELAWCDRTVGDAEVELARQKARREALATVVGRLAQRDAAGRDAAPAAQALAAAGLAAPDVPAAGLPPSAAEARAQDRYRKTIAAAPDAPLAVRARFELAEMMADRGAVDAAADLLAAVLLAGPPEDVARRARLRLGACLLAKGDPKAAAEAAAPIAALGLKPDHPPAVLRLAAEARLLQAEAMLQRREWSQAAELLLPFREQDPVKALPDLSDRALVRLGQAYARSGQWEPSRLTFEAALQRFPQSDWAEEARFGVGFSLQNQGRFDEAVNAYAEVTRRSAAEVAARAQVHVGLCRLAQKRYPEATAALLAVPAAYDYPEWSAAACLEAARAFAEQQRPKEAAGLLRRVVDEFPQSKSAAAAKAKLDERR